MWKRALIGVSIILGGSLGDGGPARAHPHVFVDTVTSFIVADGHITGLRLHWRFDAFFSAALIQEFHTGSARVLSPVAVKALESGAFQATADQNYFTHVKLNGKPLTGLTPRDFTARIDGEQIIYEFALPLPRPVDPRTTRLSVSYYESSYYVDVVPTEIDPVKFIGDGSLRCRFDVREDKSVTIFYGVHPAEVALSC